MRGVHRRVRWGHEEDRPARGIGAVYGTQSEIDGKPTRIFRPRILIYMALLGALLAGFAYAVAHRSLVDLDVLRDRNTLYRELDDGRIENVFTVRIINKDQHAHAFRLSATGLPNAVVDSDDGAQAVEAENVKSIVVRVRIPGSQEHGGKNFVIAAQALDEPTLQAKSRARFYSKP